jgi:hypothetical protein
MVFQDGSSLFEIDDVATKLAGFKFTIRNNLDQWFLGTKSSSAPDYQIIEASRPGRRKISGELLLVPTTNAFNVKVRGRTRWKTELGIQGYKNSTTDRRGVFTIASCLPRGYQWQRNLDQAGRLTVPFGSRRLGATASISATWSDVVV